MSESMASKYAEVLLHRRSRIATWEPSGSVKLSQQMTPHWILLYLLGLAGDDSYHNHKPVKC
jgi:hypothetical protein